MTSNDICMTSSPLCNHWESLKYDIYDIYDVILVDSI